MKILNHLTFYNLSLRHLALTVALLLSLGTMAQETEEEPAKEKEKVNLFTSDIQFRTRGEMRYGGLSKESGAPIDKNSNFIIGRTRVILGYERKWLAANVNLQHIGVWGQEGRGSFNVNEAWAKVHSKQGLFAQVGRIALSYDDERIIGPDDWSVASLSHDALRAGYEGHGHKAHAIFCYNQNAATVDEGGNYYSDGALPYKLMQTVWYHYDVPTFPLSASILFMNIGMQAGKKNTDSEHNEWQQLLGAYVKYEPKKWSVEASYYRQMGHEEHGLEIDAWMASICAKATPKPTYGFIAGYDYLSGDENFVVPPTGSIGLVRHEKIRGFNPVYGSHHKFYGAMDFFYVTTYYGGFSPGLQNAYAGGFVRPVKGLDIGAKYHFMGITANIRDMNKILGHQVEVEVSYTFLKCCTLTAGYTYMHGTETMERLKRTSANRTLHWGWLMLNITPRVFYTKW